MSDLLIYIGNSLLNNILQIIAGCLLSFLIYKLFIRKKYEAVSIPGVIVIVFTSLAGMLLPLTAYGLIPIFAVLLAVGFRPGTVIPLLISNALFNMQIPYTCPGFIWKTGLVRVAFALIAGVLAGIIIEKLGFVRFFPLREKVFSSLGKMPGNIQEACGLIGRSISTLGIFLVVGIIANAILRQYALNIIINFIFTNQYAASVPYFFSTRDVMNRFFLITMDIAYMFLDLTRMSAVLSVFKAKGFLAYVGYYSLLAMLLAISAFV